MLLLVRGTGILVSSARVEVLLTGTLPHLRRVVDPVASGPNRGRALVGKGCVVGVVTWCCTFVERGRFERRVRFSQIFWIIYGVVTGSVFL